jgi:hypothetical protein
MWVGTAVVVDRSEGRAAVTILDDSMLLLCQVLRTPCVGVSEPKEAVMNQMDLVHDEDHLVAGTSLERKAAWTKPAVKLKLHCGCPY